MQHPILPDAPSWRRSERGLLGGAPDWGPAPLRWPSVESLPGLTDGSHLPLRLLGVGYGALAVPVLVIGAVRQNRVAAALRRGDYEEISSSLVMWLTVAAVGLGIATLVVVAL